MSAVVRPPLPVEVVEILPTGHEVQLARFADSGYARRFARSMQRALGGSGYRYYLANVEDTDRTNRHHDEGCADFYPEYGAPEGGVCKVCGEQVTDRTVGASDE